MTEQEFLSLQQGNETLLDKVFKENYQKVMEILCYRYKVNKADAEDIYMETILRFRDKIFEGKVEYGNIQAYLSKTATHLFFNRQRDQSSRMKKMENYLVTQKQEMVVEGDTLQQAEEDAEIAGVQKNKINAMRWAMQKLDETCRKLLTDTIILGLKPSAVFEKYGYKNARVLTDKKGRCKKALKALIEQKLM